MSSQARTPQAILAANINAELARLGITAAELARRMHVGEKSVCRWRAANRGMPLYEHLHRLAEVCGRESFHWFVTDHADERDADRVAA